MTRAQQTALDHPCYLSGETLHPRFVGLRALTAMPVTVILTVNAGYE